MVQEFFYDVGLASVKISILLFYRMLFPGPKFRLMTTILIGVVVAWGIGNLLPSLFSCRPIHGFWDFDMQPPPVCVDKKVLYVTGSVINVLTDVAILCLPVREVLRLQLNKKSKIAMVFLFLLGGL